MSVTHARLKEVLHYEPETGVWTWLVNKNSRARAGSQAGDVGPSGYRRISLDWKRYRSNRLAYFYMKGQWPAGQVDHENLDKQDDRWINLREATVSQNKANTAVSRRNKSGHKGVHWGEKAGKWRAQIRVNGKPHAIGDFVRIEDAVAAYAAAAARHFGKFARAA